MMIVLYWDEEWKILLEVRSQEVRQPGEICFPGGHVEPGESMKQAAIRETYEELGIRVPVECIVGTLSADIRKSGRGVQPVVAVLQKKTPLDIHLQRTEVEAVFGIPVKWLLENPPRFFDADSRNNRDYPIILQNYMSHYPERYATLYWEFDGHGIWGLTARILHRFLELL